MTHPVARLVFDDDGVEVVDANAGRPLRRDVDMDTVGPRVLTSASVEPVKGTVKPPLRKMFTRLGDFFVGGTHKRDREASPAVKANRRKAGDGTRGADASRSARELAQALDEPKVRLLARAIDALGESTCRAYAEEAAATQRNGGELTANGERKRTTGGIFWSIVRARVDKETYDEIFAEERERQKERVKARRARQRAADGKENVPPADYKPTMAQILFGSIRDEHFLATRSPLMPLDLMTPKPTLKSFSNQRNWADACEDEDMEDVDVDEPDAPMKPSLAKSTPTFAQIARVR